MLVVWNLCQCPESKIIMFTAAKMLNSGACIHLLFFHVSREALSSMVIWNTSFVSSAPPPQCHTPCMCFSAIFAESASALRDLMAESIYITGKYTTIVTGSKSPNVIYLISYTEHSVSVRCCPQFLARGTACILKTNALNCLEGLALTCQQFKIHEKSCTCFGVVLHWKIFGKRC